MGGECFNDGDIVCIYIDNDTQQQQQQQEIAIEMFKYGLYTWIFFVLVSFITEMHTQWSPTNEKYASQQVWIRDCAKASHWNDYKKECAFHTSQHYPSFFAQWIDAVLKEVKWCGVDKCESLFTVKGVFISILATSLLRGGPKLAKNGWRLINNEH